jgi:hypothetical protein
MSSESRTYASPATPSEPDDLLVVRQTLDTLHEYRRVIALSMLLVALLALFVGFFMYFRAPIERVGTVRFRLLFDSPSQNQYPAGAPFSPSDITADPILQQVYKNNELDRFGDYDTFRSSVFVLGTSARNPAGLSLNLRRTERIATMPREVMEKVLSDALRVWAEAAIINTAASQNTNIAVSDTTTLQRIKLDDYLVGAEILQSYVKRARRAIDVLETLPGVHAIRAGKENRSLGDVRKQLDDVAEPEINAVLDLVRAEAVSRNAKTLRSHANNRLYHLGADEQRSAQLVRALRESLAAYNGGIIENVNRSFFDELAKLTNAVTADAYRRKLVDRIISESERIGTLRWQMNYYQQILKALPSRASGPTGSPDVIKRTTAHSQNAVDAVIDAVEHLSAISKEIVERNLGVPGAYAVIAQFSMSTTRAVSLRTVALFFVLCVVLGAILIPAACLSHAAWRRRSLTLS